MFDVEIESLRSEFSLLLSAQLQKLQDSNKKWMKLAENLMLQIHAMSKKAEDSFDVESRLVRHETGDDSCGGHFTVPGTKELGRPTS